ncbi:MAG: hypothetical protein OXD54_06685 [Candidatus Poribacteria bacterium]|nr:hypothetical protein [Candidatus Poribacteria bacterium]
MFNQDYSFTISRILLFVLISILPFMGGCGEDDDHDHEEEAPIHADADGVLLEVDGVEVYRQFEGQQTGGITLSVDDEVELHVIFLDHNEEELHLDEIAGEEGEEDEHEHDEEEAFALAVTEYDTTIIDVHLSEEDEDHGDEEEEHGEEEHGEEELSFEVIGLKAGETTIKLQLLHGDHPDFTALPIPVIVQ